MGEGKVDWSKHSKDKPRTGFGKRRNAAWRENGQQISMPYARWVWIKHNGNIPPKYFIHHLDGNPLNDDICNLVCVNYKQHGSLHKKMRDERSAKQEEGEPEFLEWFLRKNKCL